MRSRRRVDRPTRCVYTRSVPCPRAPETQRSRASPRRAWLERVLGILAVRTRGRLHDRICAGHQAGYRLIGIDPNRSIENRERDAGQHRPWFRAELVPPDDVVSGRVRFVEEPTVGRAVIDLLVDAVDV